MSNAEKVAYICRTISYPPDSFELDIPFPLEDWIASDNQSLVNNGLYLNDLRVQFYAAIIADTRYPDPALWVKQAEAEFWFHAFHAMTHRRLNGTLVADTRVLH